MTISSPQSRVAYQGNGSTMNFAIPFMFSQNEDVEVLLSGEGPDRTLLFTTEYCLTGAGTSTGGECILTTPPKQSETLVIRRNPTMVQEVDYVENDAFPAASHEAALDKLTMICQALSERLDRTISFRVSSAVTGVQLPDPEQNRLLAWNDAGTDLANKDVGDFKGVLLPLPISQGGTGGSNATEGLTNLGFGSTGLAVASSSSQSEALHAIGGGDILLADESTTISAGYPFPEALPDATNPPLVASGRIQHLAVDELVTLETLAERGTVILRLTGTGSLALHAEYKPLNGSEDVYAGRGGLLMLLNDGVDQWYSLTNKGV